MKIFLLKGNLYNTQNKLKNSMCRITALNFIKIMSAGIFFVFYFPKYGKIVEDEGEKCQKEKNETDVHPAVIAFHKQKSL